MTAFGSNSFSLMASYINGGLTPILAKETVDLELSQKTVRSGMYLVVTNMRATKYRQGTGGTSEALGGQPTTNSVAIAMPYRRSTVRDNNLRKVSMTL